MSWLALLSRESTIPASRLGMGAALSGASRAAVLGTVLGTLQVIGDPKRTLEHLFFFVLLVIAYKLLHTFELERVSAEFEDIAHRIRVRIIKKLQAAELSDREKLSETTVNTVLNSELPAITKAVITLFNAIQAGTTICFTMLFVGSLSKTAFFFIFFGSAATLFTQVTIFRRIRADMSDAWSDENT